MLDTGAGVTILNHKYAKHIGIDNVRGGEKISFTTATNQKLLAWIHPVRIEFMGKPMTIDVAFAPTVETANLLGMRSFFEQLTIAFDHKDRRVDFAFR